MWKKAKGRLIPVTDISRKRFKTYISKNQLIHLYNMADTYDTHISYLLENGLENLLQDNLFVFDKNNRLKDKVEFRTTCNREILNSSKELAKKHNLNFTDVIQCSINYINFSEIKNKSWRHRIE